MLQVGTKVVVHLKTNSRKKQSVEGSFYSWNDEFFTVRIPGPEKKKIYIPRENVLTIESC